MHYLPPSIDGAECLTLPHVCACSKSAHMTINTNKYIYVVVAGSGCICITITSDAAHFRYGLRSHGLDPDETTSVTSIGVVWSGGKPVGKRRSRGRNSSCPIERLLHESKLGGTCRSLRVGESALPQAMHFRLAGRRSIAEGNGLPSPLHQGPRPNVTARLE